VTVACTGVAAFAGDFDDLPDDESHSQPLPAEDRLWRHPSELGSLGSSLPLDPITVRRRWLANQPSKASAWTAGLVGAILATGLVALGTHLASAITARGDAPAASGSASGPTLASLPESSATSGGTIAANGIGTELAAQVAAVGKSLVYIEVNHGVTQVQCLGLGVRADGMLLAPAADVAGASSIMVMLPDGKYYSGEVVASDRSTHAASSGLALVHIAGISDLPVAPLDPTRPTSSSMLAVAVTSPGGSTISVGSVAAAGETTTVGGTVLVDAMATDIASAAAPAGSVLLGADGQVLGIVTASDTHGVVATPAWIASRVKAELLASGTVKHGWLGIEGTTMADRAGVHVTDVASKSAASEAGLRSGDTIVSVGGERVSSMMQLQAALYLIRPGTKVKIGFLRSGHMGQAIAVLDDQKM
jgi:S1-C subfamily serine protease